MTVHDKSLAYRQEEDDGLEGCGFASRKLVVPDLLSEQELDWLLSQGVSVPTIVRPSMIRVATGTKAGDGLFEPTPAGARWLVVETDEDLVFWEPKTEVFATDFGHAFALGEQMISAAATYVNAAARSTLFAAGMSSSWR